MRNAVACSTTAVAATVGCASLASFGWFLWFGPARLVVLPFSDSGRLAWDAFLSIVFFVQHSAMARGRVRSALKALVPEEAYATVYAIASGVSLLAVVLLWQPTPAIWVTVHWPVSLVPRLVSALAVAGLAWSASALGWLEALGLEPIRRRSRGGSPRPPELSLRGPYRHVRHPQYSMVLVLVWSTPQLGADRLLFNLLWSAWIVLGTFMEERDLVGLFGDAYREYQRAVPMLVPGIVPARASARRSSERPDG
jgi:protein-S-isoprenylcysteine O-methyltransferase Ste14